MIRLHRLVLTWPDVPWRLITWSLILLMAMSPVAFYPWAKTLWLALDLVVRPLTLGDLAGHGELETTQTGPVPSDEETAGPE